MQISTRGIRLLVNDTEYFLPYEDFPWFQKATVEQIHHVQLLYGFHLRWPDLDVDLALDSFGHLAQYPLVYR
ncbi:MAG TPA: DUF2442 domain-containing protein [Candidatus Omnitrophica bacterium]|nr:DUF2442 domain-containing protein [Candidatus Omnitrophota bacterium]HCI44151.1 DUF2442 domain-containing protein [Candidatus Omnitrophota bacterium]